jgi:hypothetical protein
MLPYKVVRRKPFLTACNVYCNCTNVEQMDGGDEIAHKYRQGTWCGRVASEQVTDHIGFSGFEHQRKIVPVVNQEIASR